MEKEKKEREAEQLRAAKKSERVKKPKKKRIRYRDPGTFY